jgi:glyoxylase-like metal-dependent hydrolase (beta-lactamase superfamily II)
MRSATNGRLCAMPQLSLARCSARYDRAGAWTACRTVSAMSAGLSELRGLSVFERGWLSSNNVLIDGDGNGATLIDSGHCVHAGQTVDLVRHALQHRGEPLVRVLNTHLHSDHCGGNAALQREFDVEVLIPPGLWRAAVDWDVDALSYAPTGQRCERFRPDGCIAPGQSLQLGGRRWDVLAAPGHDPHSVMFFDGAGGVLVSADALWEDGYGIVFPELAGEPGFDDVAAVLDLIESLPVRCVIPGHGAPFRDCAAALQRARARLAAQRADPARHARHAAKVLIKYHLMEERTQPWPELIAWACTRPLFGRTLRDQRDSESAQAWCEALVSELVERGVLALRDGVVHDV